MGPKTRKASFALQVNLASVAAMNASEVLQRLRMKASAISAAGAAAGLPARLSSQIAPGAMPVLKSAVIATPIVKYTPTSTKSFCAERIAAMSRESSAFLGEWSQQVCDLWDLWDSWDLCSMESARLFRRTRRIAIRETISPTPTAMR